MYRALINGISDTCVNQHLSKRMLGESCIVYIMNYILSSILRGTSMYVSIFTANHPKVAYIFQSGPKMSGSHQKLMEMPSVIHPLGSMNAFSYMTHKVITATFHK